MENKMRAKFSIESITKTEFSETLKMRAVAKNTVYPEDGSDEDNTYARFSPSGTLEIQIVNPALMGTFKAGEKYYMDFTLASTPAGNPNKL